MWNRDLQEGGKLSKSVLRVYRRCCSCCREHGQVVSGEQLSVAGTESGFRAEAGVKTRLLALVAFTFFLLTAFRAGWTRAETDFPNYYTAAVLVRKGEPLRNYYDWTWFQRQMNYARIERQLGAYTPQTPLTMLPLVGLTAFPLQRAKQIWLTLNLGFLLATVWLMSQVTRFRMEQIALLAFCGYHSLYVNFLYGQYYVFLLFLLTLAFYCVHREHSLSSGFFAGVAFGLKLYGGPFLLYFAAKRNWKAVAGLFASLEWTSTLTGPKQVWLRNVATAKTQPLTGGNFNSSSPAWKSNSKAILFASDCGRAIGLPALYRAQLPIGGGN